MIKKIKLLQQIGVFAEVNDCAKLEFDKLTFIYGLNAYGKSTLSDIFKSLANSDNSLIIKRKTIPENYSQKQKIVINIENYSITPSNEKNIIFENDSWNNNELKGLLEIFDVAFVHENIFDGLSLLGQRGTKENFTDFILGAESVTLASELARNKKDIADKKRQLKKTIPDYVSNLSDKEIKSFIELKIEIGLDKINDHIAEKRNRLSQLERNLDNKDTILSLKEPIELLVPNLSFLVDNLSALNEYLSMSFDSIKENAVVNLAKHISTNLDNSKNSENWIKEGLDLASKPLKDCPFCGQDLNKALQLIDTYKNYFNQEYINYSNKINKGLDQSLNNLHFDCNNVQNLSDVLLVANDYNGKITEDRFVQNVSSLSKIKIRLGLQERSISDTISNIKRSIEITITDKKQKPYLSITGFKSDLTKKIEVYLLTIKEINEIIRYSIQNIKEFKNKYRDDSINDEIGKFQIQIKELEKYKARIEQSEKCDNYTELEKQITELEEEISVTSANLEQSQNDYLDIYFDKIDKCFKKLGSGNFVIEREPPSDRGHKKVYGLKVKYKNKRITNSDLPFVFSESDRRALALSVFWAKLIAMDVAELKTKIIVLDDPITSFDENRIIRNNTIINAMKNKVDQIIVFTHYPNFIQSYYVRSDNINTVYLKIRQNNQTSYLDKLDLVQFTKSEYEKNFQKIYNFINRTSSEDIRSLLRPFMENYLQIFFLKSFTENDLFTLKLSVKIDELAKVGNINNSTKTSLHEYRIGLNPDSHIFTTNNEEDIRSFAKDLLSFLYNINFNN